jgi:hypothetical protein
MKQAQFVVSQYTGAYLTLLDVALFVRQFSPAQHFYVMYDCSSFLSSSHCSLYLLSCSVAGVLDNIPKLRASLEEDLGEARRLLPAPASRMLQARTAIYGQ